MAKPSKRIKATPPFDAKVILDTLDAQWKEGIRNRGGNVKGVSMTIVTASFVKIWKSIELLENHFGRKAGIKADPTDTLQQIVNELEAARDFAKTIVSKLLGPSNHRDKANFVIALAYSLNIPKPLGPKQGPEALAYVRFTARKLVQEHMQQKRGIPTLADIRYHATQHYEKHYAEHGFTLNKDKWKAASKSLGLSKIFPRGKAGRPKRQ